MHDDLRRQMLDWFRVALAAVDGRTCVARRLRDVRVHAPVSVIALGKAACRMAQGAHDVLGNALTSAFVVTKHGHAEPLPWRVIEAGHPLPDAHSLAAGAGLIEFARALPRSGTVLVLLSGGASALVEALPPGVTLEQLRAANAWLLAAGLAIDDINSVRKRLSLIKGGRFATLLAPRNVLCLAVSDVAGDDPRAIGSGPLTADARVATSLPGQPDFILEMLVRAIPAPRPDAACFANVRYEIVATNADARAAVARAARTAGMRVIVNETLIAEDAAKAGRGMASALRLLAPGTALVRGGEPIVHLPASPGRGGRAQQFALAAAIEMGGVGDVALLAVGTDGSDGSTEDCGALVDGSTVLRGEAQGFDAQAALDAADAGTFLAGAGDLVNTGPTGTNVMDIYVGVRS